MKLKTASNILLVSGLVMCLWVGAAITSALSTVGWSPAALGSQYMTAVGLVKPLHTLVDYYTHIKGIEYLICVAFFVTFPMFFKFVNKENTKATVKA